MAGEDNLIAGMAGRYATALFELARDSGELDSTAEALGQLQGFLNDSVELSQFVRSPVFSATKQSSAIAAIAEKIELPVLVTNFLQLLIRNRRLFALHDIITGFRQLLAASRDELTAVVTSAIPLDDAQTQELIAVLRAKTGKDITLNATVDPAILGGLVVKIGSRMVDSSVRTKLNNLKIAMKEVG